MSKKLNIEFIRAEFKKEEYELLTKVYEGSRQKLDYICPNGHEHFIKWDHWKQGTRCPCFSNLMKPTIEFIEFEFKKEGCKLLSTKYDNAHQKLKYICPEKNIHFINWNNWQQGQRCSCYANNVKLTIEFIRSEFEKEGYVLLTIEYKNNKQKLDYICPKGHKHKTCWSKWKMGRRCPFCSNNGISKWEKIIRKLLDSLYVSYIPNVRILRNPKTKALLELDMWFPDLNKAIECNGLYWHSKPDRKKCDKIKKQLCKDQGINLLVVTDKEWNDDTDQCKNKIQEFLC